MALTVFLYIAVDISASTDWFYSLVEGDEYRLK